MAKRPPVSKGPFPERQAVSNAVRPHGVVAWLDRQAAGREIRRAFRSGSIHGMADRTVRLLIWGCPALFAKIFPFSLYPNQIYIPRRPVPSEGRFAIVTDAGRGMRWTLIASGDCTIARWGSGDARSQKRSAD